MSDALTAASAATTTPTTSATPAPASEETSASVLSSDFETFLKMLTAQMQNQDPLNPIESTDYAVQLATFSSVEQQVLTNDLLGAMTNQLGGSDFTEHASWVGMQAGTTQPAYFENMPIEILPDPPAAADSIIINVKNSSGTTVQSIQMDATSDVLAWGGTNDDGTPMDTGFYTFEVESYQNGALMSTTNAQTYSPILEARAGANGTVFVLRGGTEISASQINALRDAI